MSRQSAAREQDRKFYGVVPAIVTEVNDDKKRARVKLLMEWFSPDTESELHDVACAYGGNGRGIVFTPEKGDQVLVAFLWGDMTQPVVIGSLFSEVDVPPVSRSDSSDQKLIRTKAGNEILFDDTAGQERIRITTVAKHVVDVSDVDKKITIDTGKGTSITIEDSGAVTVKGSASVTLDSPSVKLGTGASFSVILGDLFMALFNGHTHNCTAPGTPSGPPIPTMTNAMLSTITKTA